MTDRQVALITGIAGQDGSYLAEHLLELGYEVHGTLRRNSVPEHQESRVHHLSDRVNTHYADLQDEMSILRLVNEISPGEVYNLAAQSHVRISFEVPRFTGATNAIGVLGVLEAVRQAEEGTRMYQASSSEMFGTSVDPDGYQRETTPMLPASPYGCAKLYAYHMCRTYRDGYGLYVANGILFNHESPRRGSNFVTNKVVRGAVDILEGKATDLTLGNLDAYRDWGHSYDYVRAMRRILQEPQPDDFVIATGETKSVRDLCDRTFGRLNMDYKTYVRQDPAYFRPKEVPLLRGDASKARERLEWRPQYTFESLIDEMVDHELARRGING